MTRARDEQGFVLVTAIVLLTVIIGLGLGLLLFADSQQKASAGEQARESAFNLAEAALNAQVGQVSRAWPGVSTPPAYPEGDCTALTSTSTGCPDPGGLSVGYPKTGSATCPAGTQGDAWGSPLSNRWTTYVRAPAEESPLFNSKTEQTQPMWATGEHGKPAKLWVRAVGVAQCRVVTLVTLVSQQFVTANFPKDAVAGNWFKTSNKGNKLIVNTQGNASKAGDVSMRCTGFTGTEEEVQKKCKSYGEGQVSPDTTKAPASPSPTLSATQLAALKEQAQWEGHYYPAGSCPASMEALSGLPTYVEGPCVLSYTKGEANSAASPGFLVLANGTLELNGNSKFFGAIYAVNQQNSSEAVVIVHGTNKVVGSIIVDGNGGIEFGSSKENMEYEPAVTSKIKTYAGATPTRNSFRVLPSGQ